MKFDSILETGRFEVIKSKEEYLEKLNFSNDEYPLTQLYEKAERLKEAIEQCKIFKKSNKYFYASYAELLKDIKGLKEQL